MMLSKPKFEPILALKPLDQIFHPSDFTSGDENAFIHALRIALAAQTQLVLFHADKDDPGVAWEDFPHVRPMLEQWGLLEAHASHADVLNLGLRIEKVARPSEKPVKAIARYVMEHRPSLVVLATHQRQGLDRLLHKSIAEPIARSSRTMTLFVPRGTSGFVDGRDGEVRLRKIMIPVDKSPNPKAAVDAAAILAKALEGSEVHFIFLHVGKDSEHPLVDAPKWRDWTHEKRSWEGPVVDHIIDSAKAEQSDLIVMATHGHDGFLDALRGSTTERVLRESPCPVLAVPAM